MKTAILTLVIFFTSSLAFTQIFDVIGISSGITLANQKHEIKPISYLVDNKSKVGMYTSLFLQKPLNDKWNLKSNIGLFQKGCKSDFYGYVINHLNNDNIEILTDEDYKNYFTYLTFDPILSYNFQISNLIISPLIGPSISYLLNYSTDSKFEIPDQNKYTIGVNAGFEIVYKLSNINIGLETKEIYDFSFAVNDNNITIKNRVLTFGLKFEYLLNTTASSD